jgi:hypothetical protein
MPTPKRQIVAGKLLCTACAKWKTPEEFSPRKERPSGRISKCRTCQAERTQAYRARNPERVKASRQAAALEHPDRAAQATAAYRLRHPDRVRAERAKRREARKADPEKHRARDRELYLARRDEINERKSKWRAANIEKVRAYSARSKAANPEKTKAAAAEIMRRRRATPRGKLENAIRAAVYVELVPGSKRGRKTFELLGYTVDELRIHLERQFLPGMSWANYGMHGWHIDHCLPLASFKYETPDDPEFKAAWALTNLRPLWAMENRSKGAKRLLLI